MTKIILYIIQKTGIITIKRIDKQSAFCYIKYVGRLKGGPFSIAERKMLMAELGFGFLRMPQNENGLDYAAINKMVDAFMVAGGTYFDTAYMYLDGKSEEAIRKCVVERYPRESFFLADKMPGYDVTCYDDCRKYFEESCRRCGVEYFDLYMLHWLNEKHYRIALAQKEFEFLKAVKAEGKAKLIGFSFHDTAALLDEILTDHPEVDVVLLQINYLDWESPAIQSRLCYETALRHGKTVVVMEPAKGGTLAKVPPEAETLLKTIDPNAGPAALAIRFARSLPGVHTVLSGMKTLEQMHDNLRQTGAMSKEELETMAQAAEEIRKAVAVPCTGCGYCLRHCPKEIPISRCFSLYNEALLYPRQSWKIIPAYAAMTAEGSKASNCIGCGSCEEGCPQKLPIREHLKAVAETLEV